LSQPHPQFSPCRRCAGARPAVPEQADPHRRPFAAGGTSDILAPAIGPRIAEVWNQPVIGKTAPAPRQRRCRLRRQVAPDGTTLLLSDVGALSI